MNDKKNIKPEIAWSQFRQRFAPGFENVLEIRVHKGWYSPGNLLESLVFRWVFIPWLQAEIDNYVNRVNTTAKRADRNKILPHGVPNDIFQYPDDYGALDFKIMADTNAIEHVRSLYAPRGHDVFKFVPDDFAALAAEFYGDIGNPPVSQTNVWEVYLQILQRFEHPDTFDRMPRDRDAEWGHVLTMAEDDYREEHLELIPNLENLAQGREGYIYYGGVNNGLGIDDGHHQLLDAMIERDEPLLAGTQFVPIIEDDFLLADLTSDEEDENSEEDENQVEKILTAM